MKHVNVPAQITTVEDKIAGNLTINQILILATPIFLDFALYAVLPKSMHLNFYKLLLMAAVTLSCCIAAIRYKGKILLIWAVTIAKYNVRPRYFVFNKNDEYLRNSNVSPYLLEPVSATSSHKTSINKAHPALGLADEDKLKLINLLDNPKLNLSFMSHKKGSFRVYISEVE